MSLRINHNVSALNSHRNLHYNNAELSKSLERLSSGLKINRASDGPASLVISEQMRAQIGGLDQAIRNSETGVSMVQTTEAALNEVANLLVNIRQLAVHASNEGANDEVMLNADQQEVINSLENIDRIAQNTSFGTVKILDGSNGVNGVATGDGLDFVGATTKTKGTDKEGYVVAVTQNATRSTLVGTQSLTEDIVKAGETFKILEGGKVATYTTTSKDTVSTAIQNLQAAVNKTGLDVRVSADDEGHVKIQAKSYGEGHTFQASSTTAGILSPEGNAFIRSEEGKDVIGTINGEPTSGVGQVLTGNQGAKNTDGLEVRVTAKADTRARNLNGDLIDANGAIYAKDDDGKVYTVDQSGSSTQIGQFDANGEFAVGKNEEGDDITVMSSELQNESEVSGKIDSLKEAGLNERNENYAAEVGKVQVSQNSVQFQVGANEGQTVSVSLLNSNSDSLGKGLENESGYKSLADIDVRSFQGAQDAMGIIDKSINEISSLRAELGAFQKNTLESNLVNLRVAHESLVASESVLRDADMAAEMAQFTRNKIMTQSATAMLAQANQVPPNVLTLMQ